MIVCAMPRCGATAYCLDRSKETGLEFVGELNPIYIDSYGDSAKQQHHETGFQPLYSAPKYCDVILNPDKYIVLINQSPHLAVHDSDVVMLRKNIDDMFLSQANFFVKCRPYLKGEGILQHLYLSFQSFVGVLAYLSHNTKDIVWYEDYFGISGTTTEHLDGHVHGKVIKKHIDSMANNPNVLSMFEKVKNNVVR